MPTDPQFNDAMTELRRLLFDPEHVASQLKPHIDAMLRGQTDETRQQVTQLIAPVLGEAVRRVERKADEQNRQMQVMVEQTAQQIDDVAQSQQQVAQEIGKLLTRIEADETVRGQMAQQLTTTLNQVNALTDSQREMDTALVPPPSPSRAEQRQDVIEAVYAEINKMVEDAVLRSTLRLEDTMRREQAAVKQAEERSSWWLKVVTMVVLFLIFFLLTASCLVIYLFYADIQDLSRQMESISQAATATALAESNLVVSPTLVPSPTTTPPAAVQTRLAALDGTGEADSDGTEEADSTVAGEDPAAIAESATVAAGVVQTRVAAAATSQPAVTAVIPSVERPPNGATDSASPMEQTVAAVTQTIALTNPDGSQIAPQMSDDSASPTEQTAAAITQTIALTNPDGSQIPPQMSDDSASPTEQLRTRTTTITDEVASLLSPTATLTGALMLLEGALLTGTVSAVRPSSDLATPSATPLVGAGRIAVDSILLNQPDGLRVSDVIAEDTLVQVLAQDGAWYQVTVATSAEQLVGWIPTECIKLLSPLPAVLITPTP